jgi:phytoene dehydrogenase-like protein
LSKKEYKNEKEKYEDLIFQNGLRYLSNVQESMDEMASRVLLRDTFTPKTIKRFTNHENGTLYGSPTKSRNGSTKLKNLFLAGTDQGYIGIVGAMLGGIAVANNQILRPA